MKHAEKLIDIATVTLRPEHFDRAETVIASYRGLTASTFRYGTGVPGLRIDNGAGFITLLPFQGQQIWDAFFHGRSLTMRSIFDEPVPTQEYLATYGAFFIHCGATAMGNVGPEDTHPPHGELPNATYQNAELLIGEDELGPFMGLSGRYRHAVAFTHHYVARPSVRLHAGSTRIHAEMHVENRKGSPMELMYLAHVNFRLAGGGRIVDTVADDRRGLRIRSTLPAQFVPSADYARLRDAVIADPGSHRSLAAGQAIDPELVIMMDCAADSSGWSHALQIHPDGATDFISHRPDELDHGVRWMVRNRDQEALGLVLPATAEPDGYTAEKAKGNLRVLAPGESFRCRMIFGALAPDEVATYERLIDAAREGAMTPS